MSEQPHWPDGTFMTPEQIDEIRDAVKLASNGVIPDITAIYPEKAIRITFSDGRPSKIIF